MSNLPLLRFQPQDADGLIYVGAKLNFYEAGTSTPLDTYTTAALSVAHSNPVVADANGRFDRIFMDPSVGYKVVLTDSDDNVIWTEDNVYANSLGQDDLIVRIQNAGNSPLDYGAIGDGAANETSFVQAAIDGASKVPHAAPARCSPRSACSTTISAASRATRSAIRWKSTACCGMTVNP